ncbi:hypothetical protein ACEPAI_10087 [Sanghuangporus weigelae]
MMLPMQTHAQSKAAFMSPVSSPSFSSHAATHAQSREQGNLGVDVRWTSTSARTWIWMLTSLFPPSSSSVSAGSDTAPSSDAGSTQVPLPHLSSYSSLTGWAGTASPFSPRHGPGSGMSASPGASVYEML